MFCTWFQRQPFWSENCFSLLKRQFLSSLCIIVCIIVSLYKISPYNKQNISRWRGNMDFMFTVKYPIFIQYVNYTTYDITVHDEHL